MASSAQKLREIADAPKKDFRVHPGWKTMSLRKRGSALALILGGPE
jgi:hypothetical protein